MTRATVRSLLRSVRWTICLLLVATVGSRALAQETASTDSGESLVEPVGSPTVEDAAESPSFAERIAIFRPQRPPGELLKLLDIAFGGQDVEIVADEAGGALVARGTVARLERLAKLLEQLDQSSAQLTVELTIEVLSTSREQREQDVIAIPVSQNRVAKLSSSQQSSTTSGQMVVNGRQFSRNTRQSPTGITVEVTPRVAGDRIEVDLLVEKSWFETAIRENDDNNASDSLLFTGVLDTTMMLRRDRPVQTVVTATSLNGDQRKLKIAVTVRETRDVSEEKAAVGQRQTPRQNRRGND